IAEDDASARAALDKAKKIYGGHMGGTLEEHGIWGSPASVIERVQTHGAAARAALDTAKKIYGGHMGGTLEEHGIWGSPASVIERIERHRAHGVSGFVIEFFGRDTREPARLFAEKVMPAFA